tara:strand:- start:757 stop:1803 length:1047 start_codon:yes stop_codon:yes gene_type:complete
LSKLLIKEKNNCGKIMIDIDSYSLSVDEISLLKNPFIAGVILFSRNIKSIAQTQALSKEIKSVNPKLLIAVDQEGGRVQRLEKGYSKIPCMQHLAKYCSKDNFCNLDFARDLGWLLASEVLSSGIDLSFAPVLDLDESRSSIISDRSFGDNPHQVIKVAESFIDGMNEAGIHAIGKHFPGHGGTSEDSHHVSVIDSRTFDEIEGHDLIPFKALKNKLSGIMTAHVLFPKIDNNIVTFSKFWLSNVLRKKINFHGAIFSDDLSMKGASDEDTILSKAEKAFAAGCNILLICNDRSSTLELLDYMDMKFVESENSIESLKPSKIVSWDSLNNSLRRKNIHNVLDNFFKIT